MGRQFRSFKRIVAIALSLTMVMSLFVGFDLSAQAAEVNRCGYIEPEITFHEITQEEYDKHLAEKQTDIVDNYKGTDNYWSKFSTPYYSYSVSKLNTKQKKFYDELYNSLYTYIDGGVDFSGTLTPDVDYSGLSYSEVEDVLVLIQVNHPELYYINHTFSISSTGNSGYVRFGVYADFATGSSRATAAARMKESIEWYLSQVNSSDTNYNKEKKIHDLIGQNVTYNLNSAYNQSCASVFLNGASVCAGYSEAFALLCNALGMPTVSITSSGHEWNQIQLDGTWYAVDVTWDDQESYVYYRYFNVSDTTLRSGNSSHNPTSTWTSVGREPCLYNYDDIVPEVYSYTVRFNGNNATSGYMSAIDDIYTDDTITIPECEFYRDDTTFVEWNTRSDGAGQSFVPGQLVSGSRIASMASSSGELTLYAIWYQESTDEYYKVVFDGNNSTWGYTDSITGITDDSTVMMPYCGFIRDGYSFVEWNTRPDGYGTSFQQYQFVDGRTIAALTSQSNVLTLYAIWFEDDESEYVLSFDGNGATSGTTESITGITVNSYEIIPDCGYNRNGYSFVEWNTKADGTGTSYNPYDVVMGSSIASKASYSGVLTLYAIWKADEESEYTLAFDGNGATSGMMQSITGIDSSSYATIPYCDYNRDGYSFVEWNTRYDGRGTSYYPGQMVSGYSIASMASPSGTVILFAIWKEDVEDTYSFTFDGNGATAGTTPAITGITKTSSVTMPSCGYVRDGYTFVEWSTGPGGQGISLPAGQTVSGDLVAQYAGYQREITWFAIWKKNEEKSDNVISTDPTNGKATVWDDVTCDNDVVPIEYIKESKVYRMYDPNRGEHFYTKNSGEMQNLVRAGWKHEANADFTAVDATDVDAIPVYRLYNAHGDGMHFYTENAEEAKNLNSVGWHYEGISHYVYKKDASDKGTLQYRLYNPNNPCGEHNWTSDISERDMLIRLGWQDEGSCWRIV